MSWRRCLTAERQIGARLEVVPMEGWQRGDWFDSTGVAWVNPSPNLRDLNEATLYPGVGMIEGTNVSVGRGTDTPFEVVGAPWIKSQRTRRLFEPAGNSGRALCSGCSYANIEQLCRRAL